MPEEVVNTITGDLVAAEEQQVATPENPGENHLTAQHMLEELFEEVPATDMAPADEAPEEVPDENEVEAQPVGGDLENTVDDDRMDQDLEGREPATPEVAESVIVESIEKVVRETISKAEKIQKIADIIPIELINAIKDGKIVPFESGYYSYPAFQTSVGLFILKFREISGAVDSMLSFNESWTNTFMRYMYSKIRERDFFTELSQKLYMTNTKVLLRDSYIESKFAKNEDPFIIKKDIDIGAISFDQMFFAPIKALEGFLTRDIFSLVVEFSKRNMNTEADIAYVTGILPEVQFESQIVEDFTFTGVPSTVTRSLTLRKVTSSQWGNSFYTVTGPKSHVARIASLFKNILTDDSWSYQGSYSAIAKAFLENKWWHPRMEGVTIPNPEKIFIPDLCTNLGEEILNKAREEIKRIRLELIPEGSVLALPSPFVFKESSKSESDMTYLTDFMTPNSLVPNTSPHAIGAVNENIDEDIGPISKVVSCGILTKDSLNSPRDILDMPTIPDNATIILKDLELK